MEAKLEAVAKLNNHRGSARKARLVLDLIRGKNVNEAQKILLFSTKRMAKSIGKLLNSAVANATQVNGKADIDNMIVNKAFADEGTIMKRFLPRAQGRATVIRRKTCHITIGIAEKE
jgi:large subunit ribosomal protein L22